MLRLIGSTNACGGMVDNEELTALKENVLEDKSFLGYESDEPIVGTMPNNGETSDQSLNCEEHFIVKRGYHAKDFKVKGSSLASQTEGNASATEILKDKIAWINGKRTVGTMPNNPAQNATLKCGQSKIIPKGYTPGGTILAANLASQTPGTATAANILSGKTAWVNGSKVSGTMANRGQAQYGGWGEAGDYYAINALPEGAYFKSGASWAPEARCKKDIVRNALGIRADKIKKGEVIAGITGTWEGYSLAGENDLYNRGVFAEDFTCGDWHSKLEPTKIYVTSDEYIVFFLKRQLNLNQYNYINMEIYNNSRYNKNGLAVKMSFTTEAGRYLEKTTTYDYWEREDGEESGRTAYLNISTYETKTFSLYIHDNEITKNDDIHDIRFYLCNDMGYRWSSKNYNVEDLEIYHIWLS